MSDEHLKSFVCESADWAIVVEKASSYEEAASLAFQQQLEKDSKGFSVGAAISVTPVVLFTDKRMLVHSPAILADCGMHNHATDLLNKIDELADPDNSSK